jgi:eukaryotic-like serine/threonine-protein kinase
MGATEDDTHGRTVVAPAPSSATGLSGFDANALLLAGRYEVLGLLGIGGMGAVYRARDRELDEIVALKMLRRELIDMPGILERFRQEVKLARKVTSPNVARTFDIGEHLGEKFLTMEMVEGESLGAELQREILLPVERVIAIGIEVCSGLAAAHAVGVVHRDLKPDNVLLAKDGGAKITDFGIAKARTDPTKTQGPTGTPAYMAPEQVTGEGGIDPRVDLYALGVMFYEMLTGQLPWNGESSYAVASARLLAPPPDVRSLRAEVPAPLAELVLGCMGRTKEERPASASDVMAALMSISRSAAEPIAVIEPARPRAVIVHDRTLKNLAVLPIRNRGAPEDDYLADGLTDDLIDSLSMTHGLRVRARGAVMKFKNEDRDPREIGRELGVDVVVEGSIRRTGDVLRTVARLVSVTDGFQLWTKRFERPASELLNIGDEVAHAVAHALLVETSAKPQAPQDPVALDLYLRARAAYQTFTIDGATRSVALFEQALARAPDHPVIVSGYAMARMTYLNLQPGISEELLRETLLVAERAVALAPGLGEAHVALANMRLQIGQRAAGAREARLAVERAPSNAEAHFALGRLLAECGRFADAIARLEIARTIDPRVRLASVEQARVHALLGEWDRADELMESARDERDDSPYLHWGNVLRFKLWRRDPSQAREAVAAARASSLGNGALIRGMTAVLEATEPQPTYEEIYGPGVSSAPRRGTVLAQFRAELAGHRGELEEVLLAVEGADALGLADLSWMTHCPLLAAVRGEPRFSAVRARVEERAAEVLAALEEPR